MSDEKYLTDAFELLIKELEVFISFFFLTIETLINKLQQGAISFDYFDINTSRNIPVLKYDTFILTQGTVGQVQKSIYRINCMDCGDRTNTYQERLALAALPLDFKSDIASFAKLWKLNGRALSLQYEVAPKLVAER